MKKITILLLTVLFCAGCRAEPTALPEPVSASEESLSTGSTAPAPTPSAETQAVPTTTPAAASYSTPPLTTKRTTKEPITVSFESADCWEVSMDLPNHPFLEPRRDIDRDFPLNMAGTQTLAYYFPFPEDFFPEYRRYTFVYTGFTFQDTDYSELITSLGNPELFDDEFSYIGYRPYVGREFDSSAIRKISVGDRFGDLTVEDARFSFEARFDHGTAGTAPESGYVKLGGSVTLKGVAVKDTDILFYVDPDSIRETEFPFLNLGNRIPIISGDGIGLYSEDATLCFLLDETDIDFGDRSFCEAQITFTDIEQSWDNDIQNNPHFGFSLCTAEKAEIKIP